MFIFISTTSVCAGESVLSAEMETIVSKFTLSMLGICVFSVIIYLGLTIYNRLFVSSQIRNYKIKPYSLRTPSDTEEAIYMFIEKNRLL